MIDTMTALRITGFVIQDRDIAILRALLVSRVMNFGHLAALFFSGRNHAAKKRIQKLKRAGLVAERPRKTFDRAVLHITREAIMLLQKRALLKHYPRYGVSAHMRRARVSDITIRHELEVMDVKAALCSAFERRGDASVTEFTTWPQLIQFECSPFGAPVMVKPDGFIRIERKTIESSFARAFYLELDRSTETLATLVNRAHCYIAYFKSGGFAVQRGARRANFRNHPFRVLFVLKSTERRNNVADALLKSNPPILAHIWLTTFAAITSDPLGAIWIRPIDFRAVLTAAPYSTNGRPTPRVYRRNRARDAHVERSLSMRHLLD